MKIVLSIVLVPALLAALALAQAPEPGNPTPISIRGCLGGSDGNYTLGEDNTRQSFKITPGGVDLSPYVGQEVTLTGLKADTATSPGGGTNSFAASEVRMISEHCATGAGLPAASISAPADVPITPVVAGVATAATIPTPAATASAPVGAPPTPAATVPAIPEPVIASPPATAAPVNAGNASASAVVPMLSDSTVAARPETTVAPPSAGARRTPPLAAPQTPSARATEAATALADNPPSPPKTSSTPVADAATLPATESTPPVPEDTPATTTRPIQAKSSSSWLWIPVVVVVLIMGAGAPLFSRWRKRRLLERSDTQNLSFSHRASSEPGISNKPTTHKAA